MPTGKFIVIDGPDGAGKGTQIERFLDRFGDYDIPVTTLREPGGDRDGERIREIVLAKDNRLSPRAKVLLFNAARVQMLKQVRERLTQGVWVFADRSYVSTLAFQCFGEGMAYSETLAVCEYAMEELRPDLILILAAPFEVLAARRASRGVEDWFEAQGEDFHRRVIDGYAWVADDLFLPVVDAAGTEEEVEKSIWEHIRPLLPQKEN